MGRATRDPIPPSRERLAEPRKKGEKELESFLFALVCRWLCECGLRLLLGQTILPVPVVEALLVLPA
jgi:hypothetical protein